jgi:RNA polymerase sigma-70 factor (ECF subfamily)
MNGKEITALIREDSVSGYKKLFDEYKNYVYAIVYNRLRSVAAREDIEECVSDVFADIIIGLENGSSEIAELSAYISTIAKRKAIRYYHRLADDKASSEAMNDEFRADDNVSETAEKNERDRVILRCIKELGEPDSTIIIMRYYYKRNSTEIARKIGSKPAAVRKRIERALDKLRGKLKAAGMIDKEEDT